MGMSVVTAVMDGLRGAVRGNNRVGGVSSQEQALLKNLRRKVLGCPDTAERLIRYEQKRRPGLGRIAAIESAIDRWEYDNSR